MFITAGKFRHLPVVEHGQVIAMLDIEKCLYDAIARMERAAEKGKAIAAAVEGVEKHWGSSVSGCLNLLVSIFLSVLLFNDYKNVTLRINSNRFQHICRITSSANVQAIFIYHNLRESKVGNTFTLFFLN